MQTKMGLSKVAYDFGSRSNSHDDALIPIRSAINVNCDQRTLGQTRPPGLYGFATTLARSIVPRHGMQGDVKAGSDRERPELFAGPRSITSSSEKVM